MKVFTESFKKTAVQKFLSRGSRSAKDISREVGVADVTLSSGSLGLLRDFLSPYAFVDAGTETAKLENVTEGSFELSGYPVIAPVVAREAAMQSKSRESHWAHMTVHGVLHLLGFDHERAPGAAIMAAREIQILDRLGFSDPYA